MGLTAPYHREACARTAVAQELADALATPQRSWDQVLARLAHRPACQRRVTLPRIGRPTAAALLTALGDIGASTTGTQLVTLAGRESWLDASGASLRQLPTIAPVGRASLRYWLSHDAKRLVAPAPHFRGSSQRRQPPSPGTGAGQRALVAVADTVMRMLSRLLTAKEASTPQKDQRIAPSYAAQRHAAAPSPHRSRADVGGEGHPGAPVVPVERGKTRAFVPVPHHAWTPGQSTAGPRDWENPHRTDEERSGVRESEVSPRTCLVLLCR